MNYKGYDLYVHPEWTEFGSRIVFIRLPFDEGGLTIHKATGLTELLAIDNAKRWIDWMLSQ